MIADVRMIPLKQIGDERGKVMHMLRSDSPLFRGFGEVYFSVVRAGAVKAWKRHFKTTQQMTVPVGTVRIVLYDDRAGSPSFGNVQSIEVGEEHYSLIEIPTLVWYGFQGLAQGSSLIANCIDLPYDDSEVQRLSASDPAIPFRWESDQK